MIYDANTSFADCPSSQLANSPARTARSAIIDSLSPAAQAALAIDAALRAIKPVPDVADSTATRADAAAAHIAEVSRKAFAGQLQDSQFDSGAR